MLAPIAVLVAYEAGWALFRRVGPAVAVVLGARRGAAHGARTTAARTPRSACRRRPRGRCSLPAALALALAYVGRPTRAALASVAAAGLVLAVVHPTYAMFLWLPFAGFLVVRCARRAREDSRIAAALAALVVPAGAYLVWLLPVVRDTRSHEPGGDELQRAFRQYAAQLDVFVATRATGSRREVFGRAGAVAVAALLFVPLAGLALRAGAGRRTSLGGFLAVAAVVLVPRLFVAFSDLASISQSRRAAGFWPFAFSFAGGFVVLAALLRGSSCRRPSPAGSRCSSRTRASSPTGSRTAVPRS